jgi:hypothetical protein
LKRLGERGHVIVRECERNAVDRRNIGAPVAYGLQRVPMRSGAQRRTEKSAIDCVRRNGVP